MASTYTLVATNIYIQVYTPVVFAYAPYDIHVLAIPFFNYSFDLLQLSRQSATVNQLPYSTGIVPHPT